jgi:hypothetical protein
MGTEPAELRRIEEGETITEYEVWDKLSTFHGRRSS